jgi:UDP-N-acetylglucosamine 2-epimerase (non-hydrolysing)
MNDRLKVMTVVGTRPEIIRLSRVMSALDNSKAIEHIIVHTGQNYDYELNQIFFDDLQIRKPDYFLNAAGITATETIGKILINIDPLLEEIKPDAFLVLGDTNSCLCAIPAKKRHIPIFHMEAGNRCFDQRVPEELNRKIVDHLSDINMPLTEQARDYLISEGIRPETVIKTGSCMKEILSFYKNQIDSSDVLERLQLVMGKYFIVSIHREENVDYPENLKKLVDSLNALAEKYNFPVIVSTHPRTQKRLEDIKAEVELNLLVKYMKPMGFFDYIALQKTACCVISDSGTITEESSILNFPAIMIRMAHERPEGMDEGTVIMSGIERERVIEAVNIIINQFIDNPKSTRIISDYNVENVSIKVLRIILSYIDFVNRTVWKKDTVKKQFYKV